MVACWSRRDWLELGALLAVIAGLHIIGFGALVLLIAPQEYHVGTQVFGIGLGVTAYTFGLRHAFDVDHIAAIDNSTRKFIADGRRPKSVGFWFAAGHSAMVFAIALLVIATWDCFGGLVEMPAMSRIAERGIRLTQFHTTALCSPTRAALLTGRNATTVGLATVEEFTDGFPNCSGRVPRETALLSEVLVERGYNTYAVGKWHLTPLEESNLAATKRHWPLARGFERFYGFLGGETNQWYPDLVYDNHPVAPPATPEGGYHLSKDIADKTIEFIRDAKVIAPDKPWFTYLCPGAGHAPHRVFTEWADRYAGRFDVGYERYRKIVLANQKRLGIVAPNTELSPVNPYLNVTGPEGQPWPAHDTVRPRDDLKDDERRLFARMAEVFAGFLSYTDAQIGRVLDHLEESGQLDNTLIVVICDNGASGEGGPNGSVNEVRYFNGYIDTADDSMPYIDRIGTPETDNHYPIGSFKKGAPALHLQLHGDRRARGVLPGPSPSGPPRLRRAL